MKQQLNEVRRMQQLAGILNENTVLRIGDTLTPDMFIEEPYFFTYLTYDEDENEIPQYSDSVTIDDFWEDPLDFEESQVEINGMNVDLHQFKGLLKPEYIFNPNKK